MNVVRLQALHRAPPKQLTLLVVKLEGGPTASVTGTEELCDQVDQVGLQIVGTKPSEAPTEGAMKPLASTLLALSLVKRPLKGNEASDQNHIGVTNIARQL